MLEFAVVWSAVAFFAVASGLLWHALRRGNDREFNAGSAFLGLGAFAVFSYMLIVSVRLGAFPIINPWIGASFLSFLLASFALAAWLRYREPAFLAGAAPGATLFALIAAFRPVSKSDMLQLATRIDALRPDMPGVGEAILTSVWFPAHVTLALAAYALFALAATMGLLQLALLRVLKNKRGGRPLEFLPPLPVVEQAGVFAAVIGVSALLLALIIGAAGARASLNMNFLGDPKEVAGIFILIVYAIIEATRKLSSWPGRRTALAHVGAFAVLLAVFLGSSFMRFAY